MKILNIATLIPLKGLIRNNDIVLRIQDYLKRHYDINFSIARSIPYTNTILAKFSSKWGIFQNYKIKGNSTINNYHVKYYSWFSLPTSGFIVNYLLLPLNWIYFHNVLWRKFKPVIKDVDLIAAQNLFPDAILAYWLHKKTKIPYALHLRGKLPKELKDYMFILPIIKNIFKKASKVTTPSPVLFHRYNSKIDLQLIPHPVEDDFFFNGYKDFSKIKLVSVSRLLKWKNLDLVLKALAHVKRKGIKFEYKIIGDGPELDKLKSLSNKLGLKQEISFLGYLEKDEVKEHLFNSSIFILPSYFEILGIAFLEAAAAKCLIIGHKSSGVDGLFEHDKSALFVNQYNINDQLISLLDEINEQKIKKYVESAYSIVKKYRWEEVGEAYSNIYINSL